uniref:Uncharacterized protein n=1 Tax=Sus scrofa TaxID=9823 RepID=A0A8D1T4U2_PIG
MSSTPHDPFYSSPFGPFYRRHTPYMVQPEYRVYEMNKRLQSRTEVSTPTLGVCLCNFFFFFFFCKLCMSSSWVAGCILWEVSHQILPRTWKGMSARRDPLV